MKWKLPIAMWLLFLMPIVALVAVGMVNGFETKQLKVIAKAPAFELTERSGKKVSNEDLKGKVWIASFLFTSCGGQCPRLASSVRKLQKELQLKDEVRFVSFTVDPERDTLPVLKEYADRYQADPKKWLFLRGEPEVTETLVHDGFKLNSGKDERGELLHSAHLVLVDAWGRVRGYYDGMEDKEVKRLYKDTRRLIREVF